jgi:transcriptional regulator with XRE-family HTH domain
MVDLAEDRQGFRSLNLFPEQCRAARGLLDWTQAQLAALAGVSRSTIKDFECRRHGLHSATEALLIDALEKGGVRLLFTDSGGPGVQLTRAAVRLERPT